MLKRWERVFGGLRSGISFVGMEGGIDDGGIDKVDDDAKIDDDDDDDLLFFLEPPPTGTFLREPP